LRNQNTFSLSAKAISAEKVFGFLNLFSKRFKPPEVKGSWPPEVMWITTRITCGYPVDGVLITERTLQSREVFPGRGKKVFLSSPGIIHRYSTAYRNGFPQKSTSVFRITTRQNGLIHIVHSPYNSNN